MRRKIKQIDLNELIDADDINRTNIKNEMRKLWPAIHKKLTDGGWTARDMVRWLGEHGVEMSVELFRVYLRDLDREQGFERSKKVYLKPSLSSSSKPINPVTLEKNWVATSTRETESLEMELVRPPGITKSMWSEMQVKAAAEKRRKT